MQDNEKVREEIWAELEKELLTSERPSVYFEKMRETQQLDAWFPELKALYGVQQNQFHHLEGDAWQHTMLVLDEASKLRETVKYPLGFMLSALCHDFGKAVCTTVSPDGVIHSYHHETEGLAPVRMFLDRLTEDDNLKEYVLNMTELHMEPNKLANAGSKLKKTNKLFDMSVEPYDLIQLAVCDGLGKLPQYDDTEAFLLDRYSKYREIMQRPFVTGSDLLQAGIEPGEVMSETLEYAHKLRLAGVDKENALEQSLAYARGR